MRVKFAFLTEAKVRNGVPASPGDFPYQVSLQPSSAGDPNKYTHFCGASILQPRVLLSAAHCFWDNKPPRIRAVAGRRNLRGSDEGEQVRQVVFIVPHGNFQGKKDGDDMDNDIALLLLDEPLTFDDEYVGSIPMWKSNWELPGRNEMLIVFPNNYAVMVKVVSQNL